MIETTDLITATVDRLKEDGIAALPRDHSQFVQAAKCYQDHYKTMMRSDGGQPRGYVHPNWPRTWDRIYWQPSDDPQTNLLMAMALMVLECERLQELRNSVVRHAAEIAA
jgi:hypothetical protein